MKRVVICLVLLALLPSLAFAQERFVFGHSEMGRALECVRVGDEDAPKSMLMTFAVHGFEDAEDHDGRYLVEIAEKLIAHYDENPQDLCGHALYVVPCVNPDGLEEGKSKDGFGRANVNGLDINRDFPEKWTKKTTARYRTGAEPFATAEARAVRDLTQKVQPAWAADVHGWINRVYGTKELAQCFTQAFGFKHRNYSGGGMLAQWMQTQTEAAVLVELPDRPGREGYVDRNAAKLIEALNRWFAAQV